MPAAAHCLLPVRQPRSFIFQIESRNPSGNGHSSIMLLIFTAGEFHAAAERGPTRLARSRKGGVGASRQASGSGARGCGVRPGADHRDGCPRPPLLPPLSFCFCVRRSHRSRSPSRFFGGPLARGPAWVIQHFYYVRRRRGRCGADPAIQAPQATHTQTLRLGS